ncbi:MAG: hypothetical protein PVF33_03820 [Candidatus Latescibacterota bacterium]|jgi:hypothetical protein
MLVTRRTLKILAALVWYFGGIMLVRKAVLLLFEAESMSPQSSWPEAAVGVGVAVGLVKARFIFKRACRRNLARIDSLERPVWWLFFSARFLPFLVLMIVAGATSSRLAHGNYPALIGVAVLDITIGTALLSSGLVFWKERFLSKA